MQRRQFLKNALAIGAGSVLTSTLLSRCTRSNDKPNIIFIMADDLGYGDLGSYGQKIIQTPRLDQMAEEGLRFTQCYAGSTVCAPSRSVLMTGQHTGHTTVRGNFGKYGVEGLGGGSGRVPLKEDDVTVAEILKNAGYVTGMTGKWGLGEPDGPLMLQAGYNLLSHKTLCPPLGRAAVRQRVAEKERGAVSHARIIRHLGFATSKAPRGYGFLPEIARTSACDLLNDRAVGT